MRRIVVVPEELLAAGSRLRQVALDLRALEGRLVAALRSLDWEGRHRAGVEEQAAAAGRQASGLADGAERLAAFLERKARQYTEADRAGAAGLGAVTAAYRKHLQAELVAAKEAWWAARKVGDAAGMAAAHARAGHLRRLGALETEEMNREVNARHEPAYRLIQAQMDWWQAWVADDMAAMAAAHRRAAELREQGAVEPSAAEHAVILGFALAQVRAAKAEARRLGEPEQLARLQAKEAHLIARGAKLNPAQARRVGEHQRGDPDRESYQPQFDGSTPAPGTVGDPREVWRPVRPALTSDPGNRSPERYADVINQFAVETNPRYGIRDQNGDGRPDTFCNFFVWDVTRAMGAPVPHWIDRKTGLPYPEDLVMAAKGYGAVAAHAYELDANGVARWLETDGPRFGWREVSAAEAQEWANAGKPAVAAWHSGSGARPGHVAVVRPGVYDPHAGPTIAQAGGKNLNTTTVRAGFGDSVMGAVRYFVHD